MYEVSEGEISFNHCFSLLFFGCVCFFFFVKISYINIQKAYGTLRQPRVMKLCTTRKGAGACENCGCVDTAKKCRFCGARLCDHECLKYHERCCNPARACASCGKKEDLFTRLQLCGGCKEVHYCGVGCQKKHWKLHKSECVGK